MEELVAELGAAFVCADLDLTPEPRPDHAAYIANWLTVLKNEKRAIFIAASQRAADFPSNTSPAVRHDRAAREPLPRYGAVEGALARGLLSPCADLHPCTKQFHASTGGRPPATRVTLAHNNP
jgi:hypothetical protein